MIQQGLAQIQPNVLDRRVPPPGWNGNTNMYVTAPVAAANSRCIKTKRVNGAIVEMDLLF